MTIRNITYYRDLPFEDYLKLPGTSFSSLKEVPITPTEGMKLGTRVHNYLLEPQKYDWQQVELVKAIAAEIRKYVGPALKHLEKEISFTAEFIHNGMLLLYKGRGDLLRIGAIVIDFKILSGSLQAAIDRFGYDKQLSGYCYGTTSPMGLIIAYNKTAKKIETKIIKPDPAFWEYHTVSRGVPVEMYKPMSNVAS